MKSKLQRYGTKLRSNNKKEKSMSKKSKKAKENEGWEINFYSLAFYNQRSLAGNMFTKQSS